MSDPYLSLNSNTLERPLKESVRQYEREVIHAALKAHGDDKRKVAKLLDISLSSLYRKISEVGPDGEEMLEGAAERTTERNTSFVHN